jgi:taurine transport system ATP-binding protein
MTATLQPPLQPQTLSGRVSFQKVFHRFQSRAGGVDAVGPIDLTIEPGEFLCLVGPSGCGKTTLLRMLAGFLLPSQGSVAVDGKQVTKPSAERGVVFQQPTLFPWLSVRENVELGPKFRGVSQRERREVAERYLTMVGLQAFASHAPYELSGGMQQRAAIARTLANDPTLILMDEPFGALDALTRERMQQEFRAIWQRTRKTIVFITHSVEEAIYLGTRVIVMSPRPGRVVLDETIDLPRVESDVRLSATFAELRAKVSGAIIQQLEDLA